MNVKVIYSLTESQKDDLVNLYRNEFWCHHRLRHDVDKMLEHTDIIIGLENTSGQLIGFCRVLTDRVYRAMLFDVIIHPDYRGQGLSKLLMDAVTEHQDLIHVEEIMLNCLPEMLNFYQQWNFTERVGGFRFMKRYREQSS
ncbi:MAG: GNAT family N-acetyltransferase [Cyanosarcina radialis HA8281-LM2]|nr:GNAT family N-acetyltransferase [Cyanosarcina radialis HA8281-LM2]